METNNFSHIFFCIPFHQLHWVHRYESKNGSRGLALLFRRGKYIEFSHQSGPPVILIPGQELLEGNLLISCACSLNDVVKIYAHNGLGGELVFESMTEEEFMKSQGITEEDMQD